jgi:hypothetical protein
MWAAAQKHPRVVQPWLNMERTWISDRRTLPLYTPAIINKSTGFLYEFYNKNVYFPKVKGASRP